MKKTPLIMMLVCSLTVISCTNKADNNPLLNEWKTPFEIPPFDQIKVDHFMPAYTEAMKRHNEEIEAIVNNKEEATFENTIAAYDASGELLDRVSSVFSNVQGTKSNDSIMSIAKELSPLVSKHYNEIIMNAGLFKRIKSVYD
ncbi:MAG TPA: peptidase M3, partial [Bacteroidales bacterium]|nr:peptidase M3 [Bacteroidales bacterium]